MRRPYREIPHIVFNRFAMTSAILVAGSAIADLAAKLDKIPEHSAQLSLGLASSKPEIEL